MPKRSGEFTATSSAKRRKSWGKRLRAQQFHDDECPIERLPDETLIIILERAVFPGRLAAAQVCKRWRVVANDPRFTHEVNADTPTINEVVEQALPGDTILVPTGMYQETVLADKPLKFIGLAATRDGQQPTLWFSQRPPVALCNARCCFINISFHTSTARNEVSICCYGPRCDTIRFEGCRFSGLTGLHLPYKKGSSTRLIMIGCHLTGSRQGLAGVMAMAGSLHMLGCTLEHNSIGIEIGKGAAAEVRDCTIAFNNTALMIDGSALLANNCMWGNANLGCYGTQERLQRAMASQPPRTPATPAGPALGAAGATPEVQAALKRFHRAQRKGEECFIVLGNIITAVNKEQAERSRKARKQAKALMGEVYPPPDVDAEAPDWGLELLAASDLDSDEGDDPEGEDGAGDWAAGDEDQEDSAGSDSEGETSEEESEEGGASDEDGSSDGDAGGDDAAGAGHLQGDPGTEEDDEDEEEYQGEDPGNSEGDGDSSSGDGGDSDDGSDRQSEQAGNSPGDPST